ncbi:ribosomal RNA small subunit methyltransferase A, partial [Myxococcota bacterium]|nr:ribosomal RNA small subunit methyltransferase A [Myxococcota bacterium]
RVLRTAFSQRRKTLLNALRSGGLGDGYSRDRIQVAIEQAEIDPRVRAEALEPPQLLQLARALREPFPAPPV